MLSQYLFYLCIPGKTAQNEQKVNGLQNDRLRLYSIHTSSSDLMRTTSEETQKHTKTKYSSDQIEKVSSNFGHRFISGEGLNDCLSALSFF
jgi:hypothetical protein